MLSELKKNSKKGGGFRVALTRSILIWEYPRGSLIGVLEWSHKQEYIRMDSWSRTLEVNLGLKQKTHFDKVTYTLQNTKIVCDTWCKCLSISSMSIFVYTKLQSVNLFQ